jgi:hypothetical protein
MNFISLLFRILLLTLLLIKPLSATITDDLLKLSDLYEKGLLTIGEFNKAKSILLKIDKIESANDSKFQKKPKITKKEKKDKKKDKKIVKKDSDLSEVIKIERIFSTESSKYTNKSFERMKLSIGDYLIYTHRPGAIKIKKISNNKQYAVIGDKLKVKFYNNGQDFLDIKKDKEKKELILKINNSKVLVWKGKYIQKAEATFYQILAMGRLPFHFYIKLDKANSSVAINIEKFNRQIELAVERVKIKLAKEYNITISQVNDVIKENDMLAIYGEKVPTNESYNTSEQKKLELYMDLKKSIGDKNFKTFENVVKSEVDKEINNSIQKEVDNVIKVEIDDAIKEAINQAVSMAALQAGWDALINSLMAGASWAEALAAADAACGC